MSATEIIAVVRDISIISVMLVVMLVVMLLYWKVSSLLKSAKRTIDNLLQVTTTVSDGLIKPVVSGSGVAAGVGRVFGFVSGLVGQNKPRGEG